MLLTYGNMFYNDVSGNEMFTRRPMARPICSSIAAEVLCAGGLCLVLRIPGVMLHELLRILLVLGMVLRRLSGRACTRSHEPGAANMW